MALIISLSILGLLLIIAEIILIPGIFVAGTLGLVSIGAACWLAFDGFGPDAGYITIAANAVLAVVCAVLSLRSKTWKKLSLHTEIDSRTDSRPEARPSPVWPPWARLSSATSRWNARPATAS